MLMRHPDAGKATTSERAFETVWAPRGWTRVDPAASAASTVLGREVGSLEDLKHEELLAVAGELGAVPEGKATNANLTTSITAVTAANTEGA